MSGANEVGPLNLTDGVICVYLSKTSANPSHGLSGKNGKTDLSVVVKSPNLSRKQVIVQFEFGQLPVSWYKFIVVKRLLNQNFKNL
jgi:hypothetical protein